MVKGKGQEDRKEMGREIGDDGGRSPFRSCRGLVGGEWGSTFHRVSHGNSAISFRLQVNYLPVGMTQNLLP